VFALKLQEVVIATDFAIRILTTDAWAGFVDGAASLITIKELADRGVDMVFFMLQDMFDFAFVFPVFDHIALNIFFPGGRLCDAEVLCQPADIFFSDRDSGVTTAVSRAFAAVVLHFRHGTIPLLLTQGIV